MTLDDDVAIRVEAIRRENGAALKDVVNNALRLGLDRMAEAKKRPKPRFQTRSADVGAIKIREIDSIADTLSILEGEPFR